MRSSSGRVMVRARRLRTSQKGADISERAIGSDKKAEQGLARIAEDGARDGVTVGEFSEGGRNALDDARSLGASAPLRMRSIPAVPRLLPHLRFGAAAALALTAVCACATSRDR